MCVSQHSMSLSKYICVCPTDSKQAQSSCIDSVKPVSDDSAQCCQPVHDDAAAVSKPAADAATDKPLSTVTESTQPTTGCCCCRWLSWYARYIAETLTQCDNKPL